MGSAGVQDAAKGWTDLGTALGGHFEALTQPLFSAIANGWGQRCPERRYWRVGSGPLVSPVVIGE